jgi:glycerol uptake facilitator protein
MNVYIAEFVGTALLVLLGDAVVANVVLAKTKGSGGGGGGAWIVITVGWAMAVFIAVLCVADISGAHINPAVSIAVATAGVGTFTWADVPGYILAQLLGGVFGGILMYLFYHPHFRDTADPNAKLGVFCCAPTYRNMLWATFCEMIGTFVLVFAVMAIQPGQIKPIVGGTGIDMLFTMKSMGALTVGFVVLGIGLCLGGTTGYAINPARDLGPRIAHFLLPIPGKRDSDWGYAWVPVIGPIAGGLLAAWAYPLMAA